MKAWVLDEGIEPRDARPEPAPGAVVRRLRSRFFIREAARICRLTPRAIRFYEARGLIECTRDPMGVRLYDDAALESLRYIAKARRAGLSVRHILELVQLGEREGHEAQHARQREICRDYLESLEQRRGELEHFMGPPGG